MFPNEHSSYAKDEISFLNTKDFDKSSKTYDFNSLIEKIRNKIKSKELHQIKCTNIKVDSLVSYVLVG